MIKYGIAIITSFVLSISTLVAQSIISFPFGGYDEYSPIKIGFQYNYIIQNYQLTLKEDWKDSFANLDTDANQLTFLGDISSIHSKSKGGFSIGIPVEFRLHDKLAVNLSPSFNILNQHNIIYTGKDVLIDPVIRKSKHVLENLDGDNFNSFELPLNIKLLSERKTIQHSDAKYRGYLLAGMRYSQWLGQGKYYKALDSDLINNKPVPETLILNPNYISWEAGIGFDIFLSYFKVSPEVRFSQSISNVLNQKHPLSANNKFMAPIERGLIRNVYFSLIFQ